MRHYSIYTLEPTGASREIRIGDGENLDEQRAYRDNLQKSNPQHAYWIRNNQTAHIEF